MRFHSEKLSPPQRQTHYPNEDYTSWHFKEVFRGDYRGR